MPCRALEAFRLHPGKRRKNRRVEVSLNALSGIGGVRGQNQGIGESENRRISGGRKAGKPSGYSLSGRQAIGHWSFGHSVIPIALSGIGGVQTQGAGSNLVRSTERVLMPCRALEAFRPSMKKGRGRLSIQRLNALSGIGGVQTCENGQGVWPGG